MKFTVKLSPLARIGSVAFEALDPAEDARLTHALRSLRARLTGGLLKTGKPYTRERFKTAIPESAPETRGRHCH